MKLLRTIKTLHRCHVAQGLPLTHVMMRGRIVESFQASHHASSAMSGWFKGPHTHCKALRHTFSLSAATASTNYAAVEAVHVALRTRSGYFAGSQYEKLCRCRQFTTAPETTNVTHRDIPFLKARLRGPLGSEGWQTNEMTMRTRPNQAIALNSRRRSASVQVFLSCLRAFFTSEAIGLNCLSSLFFNILSA